MAYRVFCAFLVLALGAWTADLARAADEQPSAKGKTHQPGAAPTEGEPPGAGKQHAGGESGHSLNPVGHVMDTPTIVFFESLGLEWALPKLARIRIFNPDGLQVTKYMVLEVVAAILIVIIYVPLARAAAAGEPVRGGWNNAFEVLLTFIRDDVARPNLGDHDADKHVPFLWTIFLFVLFCNLLGMFPFAGSPTASIYVTGALALCSLVAMFVAAIAEMGPVGYLHSLWPHIEVPGAIGFFLKPMIMGIEVLGTFIKHAVLAVRLFANMFAGHTVLAMILLFIGLAAGTHIWVLLGSISLASILGVVALSLLELFVAFLQAYIFVFLTALFMGMAVHPQH